MKALTVRQPWAWAIIHGGKDVENRTQAWSYRGPLAIHAGAQFSDRGLASDLIQDAAARVDPARPVVVDRLGKTWRHEESLPLGAIIGAVDLVGIHQAAPDCCESPWGEQAYVEASGKTRRQLVHLELENPYAIVPVPMSGRLGLWEVDDGLLTERVCRGCGCTDSRACEGGCWWSSPGLCSTCKAAGRS